jgi:hypothetical protein
MTLPTEPWPTDEGCNRICLRRGRCIRDPAHPHARSERGLLAYCSVIKQPPRCIFSVVEPEV